MQLSAFADLESSRWDVAVDGRWLGQGPGELPTVEFAPMDPDPHGSARFLVIWLSSGATYALSALRPPNAKGQDRDRVTVGLAAEHAGLQAFDPRLSTEYSAAGVPQRFGIEVWLGEDPEGDQHPLRLAGEAPADTPALTAGRLTVHPMRAHAAGVDGLGLYLLVRA